MSKLMKKYLSTADIQLLTTLKKAIAEDKTTVTCMGLYNHGKSTLLNTLIKDFEHKTFKTADVRETALNKTVEYENISFVDTPGLNAQEYDDKRVMDAIKESDINLFVHNLTTGAFIAKEVEFLSTIKRYWLNPKEFIDRTIFVVSRLDQENNEGDIEKTIEEMKKQVFEIFNLEANIIPVSAKNYTKGKKEDKNILIKKSKITELEGLINNLSADLSKSIKETRQARLNNQYNNLIRKLTSKVQGNKLEISKQKQAEKEYRNSLNNDIQKIEDTLQNMYSRLGA